MDKRHLSNSGFNPLLRSLEGTVRKRNLALGGVFQPELSYRREILGHLHCGRSCWLCFGPLYSCEPFSPRPVRLTRFDLIVCMHCFKATMVPYPAAQKYRLISSLKLSIAAATKDIWERQRTYEAKRCGFWIYQVDDILRKKIGINYHTAVAKEQYMSQIRDAGDFNSNIDLARQLLRLELVEIAKDLWARGAVADIDAGKMRVLRQMRETYAPTSRLHEFLFAPHLLDPNAAYLPHGDGMKWLEDKTLSLTDAELGAVDDSQKLNLASLMLRGIVVATISPERGITMLTRAAEEFHMERLKEDLSVEAATKHMRMNTGYRNGWTRTHTILSKLHLLSRVPTDGVELTLEGWNEAAKVFPKILRRACVTCPRSCLLTRRGIEELVKHMRDDHPRQFWGWHMEAGGGWWTTHG